MNESTFNIFSKSQSVSITTEHISAAHDALYAYLRIPVNFVFRAQEHTGFDVLPVHAQVFFEQPRQLLSEATVSYVNSNYSAEFRAELVLEFKLSQPVLHFIEKSRTGDLPMSVELSIHTLLHRVSGGSGSSQTDKVRVSINLPRSVWVEKLLPHTGYRNLKLVEIPVTHDCLKEAYDDIIIEFNKAEHYFNLQDYNKCVAHCRSTMDTLTRQLKQIKEVSVSQTAFKWLRDISGETKNWIDQVNKVTQRITSKAHHAGQHVDFQRYEAESIYLVVLGLLHHVGNLAKEEI